MPSQHPQAVCSAGSANIFCVTVVLWCALGVQYAPEKFSGLTYRLPEPKVTIMVFNSGKFNLTGKKAPPHP